MGCTVILVSDPTVEPQFIPLEQLAGEGGEGRGGWWVTSNSRGARPIPLCSDPDPEPTERYKRGPVRVVGS